MSKIISNDNDFSATGILWSEHGQPPCHHTNLQRCVRVCVCVCVCRVLNCGELILCTYNITGCLLLLWEMDKPTLLIDHIFHSTQMKSGWSIARPPLITTFTNYVAIHMRTCRCTSYVASMHTAFTEQLHVSATENYAMSVATNIIQLYLSTLFIPSYNPDGTLSYKMA